MVAPAAVGIVFFVAGVVHLTSTWHPYGDWAVAELVIRHVGRHLPLSGPYSGQRGYDHPLPLVYAIQWLPYQLFGQRSSAGLATTVWWNGAWLSFLVWLLARYRILWLGVAALFTVPLMATRTVSGSLILPWNPSLALVPGLVLVFVAWRVAMGSRRLLPVAAALAVWCTGAHLGFAPFAVAMALVAVGGLLATTVRRGGTPALRTLVRPVLYSIGISVALASPLIIDLVANGHESNPVQIVEQGRSDPAGHGVARSEVAKVLRAELAVPPAWARSTPPYNFILEEREPRTPWLIPIAFGAVALAWRRRAVDEIAGIAISSVGVLAATAGLLNIGSGQLQPWYLLSSHAASMALCAFIIWSSGRSAIHLLGSTRVESGFARVGPGARLGAGALACFAAAALVVPSLHIQAHAPGITGPALQLVDAVRTEIPAGSHLIVDGPISYDGYYTAALALELDRAGYDVRVPDDQLYLFTEAMAIPEGWTGQELMVRLSAGPHPPATAGERLIATASIPPLLLSSTDTVSVWTTDRG